MRQILPGLLAVLLVASGGAAARDVRVIDGDTIELDGERIRIMGLDAPETHPSRFDTEYRLGMAAIERLRVLVAGGVQIRSYGQGRYHRTLAIVRDSRGHDVAGILIREGLARPYDGRGRRQPWC